MPSQPIDAGWGFDAVLDLIESDSHLTSPTLSTVSQAANKPNTTKDAGNEYSSRLGDFKKLFDELGISEQLPPVSPVEPDSESLSGTDEATWPVQGKHQACMGGGNPTSDCITDKPTSSASPEKRADPTSPLAGLTSKQQKQARKKAAQKARKARKPIEPAASLDVPTPHLQQVNQSRAQSNVGLKIRPATPTPFELPDTVTPQQLKEPVQVPQISTNTAPNHVSPQRLSSLAQSFTPNQTYVLPLRPLAPVQTASVDSSTGVPAQQLPTQSSLHENRFGGPQFPAYVQHNHGLVPRTVQPLSYPRMPNADPLLLHAISQPSQYTVETSQRPVTVPAQGPIVPSQTKLPVTPGRARKQLTIRPQTDRHFHFYNQLLANFPVDVKWLVAPMQLCNEKLAAQGIHCFVDASNILIGFRDILRRSGFDQFDMSFDSLALLMERRRPVAKRIYASSHREAAPLPHVTKLAETSRAIGYENNVKEQVFIVREDSERKKFFKDVEKMGWHKATQRRAGNGSSSDSETGAIATTPTTPSAPKWVEQGVDEVLHLKMCQSIIDADVPTTIVLATGDGNAAEFSDGFLANVERALKKGWTVELVSWKQQTSGGYKNKKFRAKWGNQFRIIELDDYLESLIDTR